MQQTQPFTDAQPEDLQRLGTPGATLQRQYLPTARRAYLTWHCPHCTRMQGSFSEPGIPMTIANGKLTRDTRHMSLWDLIHRRLRNLPLVESCRFPDKEPRIIDTGMLDNEDDDDYLPCTLNPFAPPRPIPLRAPAPTPISAAPYGSSLAYADHARNIRLAIEQARRENAQKK